MPTSYPRQLIVSDSTNVQSVSYNPDEMKMRVAFLSGAVYEYEDVHAVDYGDICSGESVGGKFRQLLNLRVWTTTKVAG